VQGKKKNILIITYWGYNDALIQAYTLPYVKLISKNLPKESTIYLVTLDKTPILEPDLSEWYIKNISIKYHPFGLNGIRMWVKTIIKLILLIRKERIEVIHTWCTPAGAMGFVLSKITGKQLVLDSYEPHAEAMVENGNWQKNSFAFRLLFFLEKLQTRRAKYIVSTTNGMESYAKERYNYIGNNFFVKPACVDLDFFSLKKSKNKELLVTYQLEDKLICVYAGKFGGIYLDKEVFDFFKVAEDYWGEKFIAIILSSHDKVEIERYRIQANVKVSSILHLFVNHADIPEYIGLGDFAITPVKPIYTKKFCTPIKDGEYWALGLPVVITKDISDDSEIIKNNRIGAVLERLDTDSYLQAVKEIDNILTIHPKQDIQNKIRLIAAEYRNFEIADKIYKTIYAN
jgi:glycosyltransferase involved in cell wall biosynthesis